MSNSLFISAISSRHPEVCCRLSIWIWLSYVLTAVILLTSNAHGQNYLTSTGAPRFSAPELVEYGFTDVANGNLHLEIPLGSSPQRGTQQPQFLRLVYDSNKVWGTALVGASITWTPNPEATFLLAPGVGGSVTGINTSGCNQTYTWTEPLGTQHEFAPIAVNYTGLGCPTSGSAFAADSSGYKLYIQAGGSTLAETVYAPDGTLVFTNANLGSPNRIAIETPNGNYLSCCDATATSLVDTVGRVLMKTTNASGTTTYVDVPNSQGSTSRYTITYSQITVSTAFSQSGIVDCNPSTNPNCTVRVTQSIQRPDGNSFVFKYDCKSSSGNPACGSPDGQAAYYGLPISMTLPTGGQVTYGWANVTDAYGNKHRNLASRTSGGGTWQYSFGVLSTCTSTQVGCQQTMTVSKPSSDTTVYTFTLNNGAWPTKIQKYRFPGGSANLLSTTTNTWDFSQPCVFTNCIGASYIRKLSEALTLVTTGSASVTKQTTYSYDSPSQGNIIAVKEWNFRAGTAPTFPSVPNRATYLTYYSAGNNIINKPTVTTLCNNSGTDADCPGGGSKVSQVKVTYDSYGTGGLVSAPAGVFNHDTTFGASYTTRGNPTQISQWVSGTTYLTTQRNYDTTGQIISSIDPAQHSTTYSYADVFFNDTGVNPPPAYSPTAPTNAYVTSVTSGTLTESFGYYYGSGKVAVVTDPNGAKTYNHFSDSLDRSTQTNYPVGWTLDTYPTATEADIYTPVADASASSGCSSCVAQQSLYDAWGRRVTQALANAPGGSIKMDTTYDSSGRVAAVSHAYVTPSDPSHVFESFSYDGLDRTIAVTHGDNQSAQAAYGLDIQNLGGVTAQQSPTTTYGFGYPVASFDEAGRQRQQWIDGFGHIIEADEPSTNTGTPGSASITINGGPQWASTCPPAGGCQQIPNSGSVFVTVDGVTSSTGYGPTSTTAQVASGIAAGFPSSAPFTASASGGTVIITAVAVGASTDFSYSTSATYSNQTCWSGSTSHPCFTGPAFSASPASGSLSNGSGGIDASPSFTSYQYDAGGRLTTVSQGLQTRTFTYDGAGRPLTISTPEAGTDTLTYDNDNGVGGTCPTPNSFPGHLVKKIDARGTRTCFQYDSFGRITQKNYSNGQTAITYQYDQGGAAAFALGRLTKITDGSGSETFTYDTQGAGRIVQINKVVGSVTYTLGYSYNAGGEVTQITYPSGRTIQKAFDIIGRLSSVSDTKSGVNTMRSSAYAYYPSGNVQGFTYGNGVTANFTFSPTRDQLTALSYSHGTTTLFSLNYFYQADAASCPSAPAGDNGDIACIYDNVDAGRSIAYSYDSIGRMIAASTTGSTAYPQWGLSWSYDRYGNRLNQTVTAGSGFSSTLAFGNPGGAQTNRPDGMCFDASGNLLAETATPCPPTSPMYSYDAQNWMTAFSGTSGAGGYVYDSHGNRVKKCQPNCTSPTTRTVYIFSAGKDIAEYDNGAAPTSPSREYIYSGSSLLTTLAGTSTTYHHSDHISVRLSTDNTGSKVGEQGHYPYGEAWYTANSTTKFIFTSYERDSESGNDYAMARYYHVRFGRFCSVDPVMGSPADPQSWNRYAYARDNPVTNIDPSGLNWFTDFFKAIFSIFQIGNYGVTTPPTFPAQDTFDVWQKLQDAITPPMTMGGTPPILGLLDAPSAEAPDPAGNIDIDSLLAAAADRLDPGQPQNSDCIDFVNKAFNKVGATNYDGTAATAADLRALLPKVRTDIDAIPPEEDPDLGLYAAQTGGGSSIYISSPGFAKVSDQPAVLIGEGLHLKQFGNATDLDFATKLGLDAKPTQGQTTAQAASVAFHKEVGKHCPPPKTKK